MVQTLSWWLSGKESAVKNPGDLGFDPWVKKIAWRRAWQPLQYPYLENPMDRAAWWAAVHEVTESDKMEHVRYPDRAHCLVMCL